VPTTFFFAVPGGLLTAAVLFVAFAGAAAMGVRDLVDVPPRRRGPLMALRVASALVAWLVCVQPRWTVERFEASEGRLAILVDASRSLGLPQARPRAPRVQALLDRWAAEGGEIPPSTFTFGEALLPTELHRLAERLRPQDDRSDLAGALAALLSREEGLELGAVVVVSDGAIPDVPLDPLTEAGIRVHAVAVGEDAFRDDSIVRVEADPVAFLRRAARVRVTVRRSGAPPGPVPVTLRRGEQVEREVVAEVGPQGEATIDLPVTADRLGRAVYRVSIPRSADDAVPENNERAFLMRVTRDKLRVLLVAGQPSWDERFLRAFLQRDPATDLISFFILRNTSDLTMAGPEDLALIPFPTDELFNEHLGSFDVVLFQNFEYGPYQMAGYLPRIRDYVLRGGSFAMIGGPLSFGSGDYAGTPLAEVLPVEVPARDAPEAALIHQGRFRPVVAEGLLRHPLVALMPDPARTQELWGRLSELEGTNGVERVRSAATVLLERPEEPRDPVLVVGTAGRGRTLALTTDTSWRWGITSAGATGDASAYERFWDRTLRWLARDPSLEPAILETDRERYGPGSRVRVRARLADDRHAPYAERPVQITLRDLGGRVLEERRLRTSPEGELETTFAAPERPDAYAIEARLGAEEEPLAGEWIVVEAGGDELADPRARPGRLEALAEATGGTFAASPEDAPPRRSLDTSRVRSLGTQERAPLGGWLGLLLLAGVFVTEWVLRRRWGRR
jgi:uncharacterized membrane protein